jgi:hypothetical protein
VGSFKLSDLSEAASPDELTPPDWPSPPDYFFAVSLPRRRIGRAGVIGEAYLDEPDDNVWRERVLARLNEIEDEGWKFKQMAKALVDPGLIVVGRTIDPPERGPFPRPLTDTEKGVARRVLELDGVAELDLLLAQLEAAVATAPCDCPCPTVSIEVDHARAKPISNRDLRASASWERGSISVAIPCGWLSEIGDRLLHRRRAAELPSAGRDPARRPGPASWRHRADGALAQIPREAGAAVAQAPRLAKPERAR